MNAITVRPLEDLLPRTITSDDMTVAERLCLQDAAQSWVYDDLVETPTGWRGTGPGLIRQHTLAAVQRLADLGLVEITADTHDGRRRAFLTLPGHAAHDDLPEVDA